MVKKKERTIRVGLLVAVALTVLMLFLFFIGSEQKIFARKNVYEVELDQAAGLANGNPVKMSGVTIGVIGDIKLPEDPRQRNVGIKLMVDRKYAERIRGDSRVRLKKLGLLTGDAYIDVTPGTPRFDQLPAGAIIPAQRQANVDQLLSSGEDLVDNFVQVSYSLKNILARVDRGEGLLGEITTTPETKQRLTDTLLTTLNKTNAILARVESGRGTVGKLIYDDKYGDQLTGSLAAAAGSLQSVTASVQRSFESGTGTIPALLSDPQGKDKVLQLVENLRVASQNLATFSAALESGEGLVPRLLSDKPYADQALNEFSGLLTELNQTVAKINAGQGTAGKIIADPSLYESINDILIGINESRMLRWLIRNRQQRGIEQRFEEEQKNPAPVQQPDVRTKIAPSQPAKPPVVPPATETGAPASTDGSVATTTTQGPPH